MQDERRFHAIAAIEKECLMGFVTYWTLEGFNYIEHLAVDKSSRRRGIGGDLVRLVSTLGQTVLLEVEPPVDEPTRKRVAFYEGLGLVLHDDISYLQPPYGPGKPPVPLQLMTSPTMSAASILAAIPQLHRVVYRHMG